MLDKPLTIAVSGAAGKMAKDYRQLWLYLAQQGHEVRGYDPKRLEMQRLYDGTGVKVCTNNGDLVQGADVVLLFVPVPKTREVLKAMGKYLTPHVVLGSAASSKELVAEQELEFVRPDRYTQRRIVEFHPMHGDDVPPKGQNFLTAPVRDFAVDGLSVESLIQQLFLPAEVRMKHVNSVTKHDESLGPVQGGNHSIAFYRDTAWYLAKQDPDSNPVNTSPLDDAKSLHARRPLDLNLEVYVVTMRWNRFVRDYVRAYADIFGKIDDMRIDGRREDLVKMFEEAREHITWDTIKDARERLVAAYGVSPRDLDSSINSHISDLAWGVLYKNHKRHPMEFVDVETPHYILGRVILCAVYGSDIGQLVDNFMRNPQTQRQDLRFSQAVPVVNQIIEDGDDALLRHLERLKRFYNGKEGVKMRRDLNTVGEHSRILGRSLKEHSDEYAHAYANWKEEQQSVVL